MSANDLNQELKKSITVPQSIYANAQEFKMLSQAETWAQNSKNTFDRVFPALHPYLIVEDLEGLTASFKTILDDVLKIKNDEKDVSERSLNSVGKKIQALINETVVLGQSFATPSMASDCSSKNNNPQFQTAYLTKMFGIEWLPNSNQIWQMTSHQLYAQASNVVDALLALENATSPSLHKVKGQKQVADLIARWVGLQSRATDELEEIENLLKNVEKRKAESEMSLNIAVRKRLRRYVKLFNAYKSNISESNSIFDKSTEGHEKEMGEIRKAFSAELALSDPASYWSKRATNAGWAALIFGAVFAGLSVLAIGLSLKHGPTLYGNMVVANQNQPLPIASLAVFTFPVIVVLWVLKALSRVFVENLHIHQDAKYRHMMITTYLSMLKDPITPITPDERRFALLAVFNEGPGAPRAITAPTEQLAEVLKVQK